jgi:GntR family transcriptional regulator/MocR family aminotransferase
VGAEEKHLNDRGSPGLDQLALATLIESSRYDRRLRRMRAIYARRRGALVEALAQHAPTPCSPDSPQVSTTGALQRVPVNVVELADGRYLVSVRGRTEWVRNLRSAGHCAIRRRGVASGLKAIKVHPSIRWAVGPWSVRCRPRP